jgi:multidrug efflux pump subunit AcrA (membrane-fusion protein)
MPIEAQETAERQAAVDHAALVLAERRLSATYGQSAPWKENYTSPLLASLARGDTKLARVTFPLGALGSTVPARLRLTRIGATPGSKSIETVAVWSAPADATIPGRSFFAILKGGDASEGERLIAHAAVGDAENGVVVPYTATVINAGKYWCYVEERPGLFVRTEINPGMPTDDGYFVKEGIAPGARIVTTSAGLLLARETNPSSEAD